MPARDLDPRRPAVVRIRGQAVLNAVGEVLREYRHMSGFPEPVLTPEINQYPGLIHRRLSSDNGQFILEVHP